MMMQSLCDVLDCSSLSKASSVKILVPPNRLLFLNGDPNMDRAILESREPEFIERDYHERLV
jgi:hypothetical protein